ncbi:MAG: hypothetical protein ACTHJL_07460, partial [Amnibacterium sp.]
MRARILAGLLAATAALALAGCAPASTTRPSPAPTRAAVEVRDPRSPVTVLDGADPVGRAVGTSRALFAASPGVILAAAADASALRRATEDAARLRVPVLLVPAAPGAALDAVRAETARLSASWAVPDGTVPSSALAGLHRVDPARQAPPPHPRGSGAVVLVEAADGASAATARAAGAVVVPLGQGEADLTRSPRAVSALAAHPGAPAVLVGAAFAAAPPAAWTVASARSGFQLAGGGQRPLPGHRFVALYGVPGVPVLGALGDQGIAASIRRV